MRRLSSASEERIQSGVIHPNLYQNRYTSVYHEQDSVMQSITIKQIPAIIHESLQLDGAQFVRITSLALGPLL